VFVITKHGRASSLLVGELLVNRPDLFLNVDALRLLRLRFARRMPIVALYRSLLASRQFILADSLACDRIEDVTALTGKSFQIVGHIGM